jgi:two-component system response regulator YesN
MGIRSRFMFKQVFFFWFLSYLLMFSIPSFFSYAAYKNVETELREEITHAHTQVLRQFRIYIESKLKELDINTLTISNNSQIMSLIAKNRLYTRKEAYDTYQARLFLERINFANYAINDLFLYFRNKDHIVSGSRSTDRRMFYDLDASDTDFSWDAWRALIETAERNSLVSVSGDELYYFASLVGNTGYMDDAVLVYVLDKQSIRSDLTNLDLLGGSSLFMRTSASDPEILLSWGDGPSPDGADRSGRTVLVDRPDDRPIEFGMSIPQDALLGKVLIVRRYTIVGFLGAIMLGLGAALFFTLRHYSPTKSILSIISHRSLPKAGLFSDEYSLIIRTLTQSFEESDQKDRELRDFFLIRLIRGQVSDEAQIAEGLRRYGIDFSYDWFNVILINLKDTKPEASSASKAGSMKLLASSEIDKHWILSIDNSIIVLLNFENGNIDINRIVEGVYRDFEEHFSIDFSMSVGNAHAGTAGLRIAYREALEAIEYAEIFEKSDIITQDQIKSGKDSYHFTMEDENRLVNAIRSGNEEEALALFDRVVSANLAEKRVRPAMGKLLLYNLAVSLLRQVFEPSAEFSGKAGDFADKLVSCNSLNEMRVLLEHSIGEYCRANKGKLEAGQYEDLVRKVKAYIESRYTDKNLNVAELGEQFRISPYYLSRIFKDSTTEGLLDYIHKRRIDTSIVLIKSTDATVQEVANQIGYDNIHSFIRIFKKFHGLTPGEFKKLHTNL